MKKYFDNLYNVFLGFSVILFVFGFSLDTPYKIWDGLVTIVLSPDILVTDYIEIAGIGAAFINSGLVMLMSVLLLVIFKHEPTRYTAMTLLLAGGFAFFGKNPVNITPILFGGFLFSVYLKEPFQKNVLATLLGTTLSPVVSQITFLNFTGKLADALGVLSAAIVGIIIGFIIEPLAKNSIKSHEGYNLYNVGFAAGILGVVIMSVFRNFGIDYAPVSILSKGHDRIIMLYVLSISIYFLIVGYFLVGGMKKCLKLMITLDESSDDFFTKMKGQEYLEMGIMGLFVTALLWLIGIELNGPLIGGIFTIVGFSCCGKKITNIIPIMIGSTTAGLLGTRGLNDTVVVMAILFSTGLSPIADKLGWKYGVIAGFMHMSVSLNVGIVNGGLNLYNNGLAAGFVVMTIVPVIRAFSEKGRAPNGVKEADKG